MKFTLNKIIIPIANVLNIIVFYLIQKLKQLEMHTVFFVVKQIYYFIDKDE